MKTEYKNSEEYQKYHKDNFKILYGRYPSTKNELKQYLENKRITFIPKTKTENLKWYKKWIKKL